MLNLRVSSVETGMCVFIRLPQGPFPGQPGNRQQHSLSCSNTGGTVAPAQCLPLNPAPRAVTRLESQEGRVCGCVGVCGVHACVCLEFCGPLSPDFLSTVMPLHLHFISAFGHASHFSQPSGGWVRILPLSSDAWCLGCPAAQDT